MFLVCLQGTQGDAAQRIPGATYGAFKDNAPTWEHLAEMVSAKESQLGVVVNRIDLETVRCNSNKLFAIDSRHDTIYKRTVWSGALLSILYSARVYKLSRSNRLSRIARIFQLFYFTCHNALDRTNHSCHCETSVNLVMSLACPTANKI